jgi:hypothetical protein
MMTTGAASSPERRAARARARAAAIALSAVVTWSAGARAAPPDEGRGTGAGAPREAPAPFVGELLRLGLVEEAAAELRRSMFVSGPEAVSPDTAFDVGMGLALSGDTERAAPFLTQAANGAADPAVGDRWMLAGAVALLRGGAIPQALHLFLRVETFGVDATARRNATRLICVAHVLARNDAAARTCVRALVPSGPSTRATRDALEDLAIRPGRRAVVGGILSALLPGLGQATAGNPGDGLLALLVNGGWGAATAVLVSHGALFDAALLSLGIGVRYYAGNIYNGAEAWRADAERRREDAGRTLILELGAGDSKSP